MDEKRLNLLILVIGSIIIIGAIIVYLQLDTGIAQNTLNPNKNAALVLGNLTFYTSDIDAIERSRSEKKMIYVLVRSDYCGWCEKFESEALTDERINSILNDNFVLLAVDFINQSGTVTNLNVQGTPTSIFLNSRGEEIPGTRLEGYKEADYFYEQLNVIISNSNKE